MPQVRGFSLTPFMLLLLAGLLLAGCGSSTSESDKFNPQTGKHPANWLPAGHETEAKANMTSCAECHGADYMGGISKVSCTSCHLGNPNSVHPVQWGHYAYALHGNYVKVNGGASCANGSCHGSNLQGVPGSGPSCSQCHMGGTTAIHPAAWQGNPRAHGTYVLANGTVSCENAVCHGPRKVANNPFSLPGVFLSGPACNACHS